jgi:rare lipoprotein A
MKESKSIKSKPSECGIASVYGTEGGHITATGAVYHPWKDIIVAHKTRKLGSIIHVTNMRNGKTIDVRVGDRGPYVKGRILDFSYAAAARIGEGTNSTFRVCIA